MIKYFRYSGSGGYVFKGEMKIFYRELRVYEQGKRDVDWLANQAA